MSDDDDDDDDVQQALQDADSALRLAQDLVSRVATLEEQVDELQAENAELRERLDEHRQLDDLLAGMQQNAANDPEKRAAVIVQTMFNEASGKQAAGQTPVVRFDKDDCRRALGGDAKKHDVWYAMTEAVPRVVDGSVVTHVKTPRSSDQLNYVEMDLREGDVAGTVVAGHTIRAGGEFGR